MNRPPFKKKAACEAADFGTSVQPQNTTNTATVQLRGIAGLKHYQQLSGDRFDVRPPVYAVVDRRYSGQMRIVQEFADPEPALTTANMLRSAGSAAEVVLITALETTS